MTPTPMPTGPTHDHPALIRLIAVACGLSVANLYYNNPLLADIAKSLGTTVAGVGVVPALSMIGYAVGMLFIVPLGDVAPRRRLVVTLLLQAAQVTNMTRIYAVSESAPSRVNSAFMVTYFVGGAAGSLLATQAWKFGGWNAVCALACAFSATALVAHVLAHREASPQGAIAPDIHPGL